MKSICFILLTLISQVSSGQQKGDNAVLVKGVSFMQVCNSLLDAGYLIDKKDNDLQTVETKFKDGTGKGQLFKYKLLVRVKDSTAIITGHHIHALINAMEYTKNTRDSKYPFEDMQTFALSFGKPVEYKKQ